MNSRYLGDCFKHSEDIKFDSFHNEKWRLFDAKKLSPEHCLTDNNSYSQFTKKAD